MWQSGAPTSGLVKATGHHPAFSLILRDLPRREETPPELLAQRSIGRVALLVRRTAEAARLTQRRDRSPPAHTGVFCERELRVATAEHGSENWNPLCYS
jgi:hypothetical protein